MIKRLYDHVWQEVLDDIKEDAPLLIDSIYACVGKKKGKKYLAKKEWWLNRPFEEVLRLLIHVTHWTSEKKLQEFDTSGEITAEMWHALGEFLLKIKENEASEFYENSWVDENV